MAIRVRKMARKVGRSSGELLGVLHTLGYTRFKSPEDMLADSVANKLSTALRRGVKPLVLVPTPEPKQVAEPVQAVAVAKSPVDPLAAEREALAALRRKLEQDRAAFEAEKAQWRPPSEPQPSAVEGTRIADLFEERGLRGPVEFVSALQALAKQELLVGVVRSLHTDHPAEFGDLIRRKLLLVGGGVSLGPGTVAVAPERGDVPNADAVLKAIEALSEELMLTGLRRVRIGGGTPRDRMLMRGHFDRRIELEFRGGERRSGTAAADEVSRTDAVILWGVEISAEAREVYDSSRATLIDVPDGTLLERITGTIAVLREPPSVAPATKAP